MGVLWSQTAQRESTLLVVINKLYLYYIGLVNFLINFCAGIFTIISLTVHNKYPTTHEGRITMHCGHE